MIWIEMSQNRTHGGGEWDFSKCLWSPTHKSGPQRRKWRFWDNILLIKKGDIVFHLQGKAHRASFVGFSLAVSDGHITKERPPEPEQWGYTTSFYRVILDNFHRFDEAIPLDDFFSHNMNKLSQYYNGISEVPKNRFFVFQSNRWQCLNGAYLSKCDEELLDMILNSSSVNNSAVALHSVPTAEVLQEVIHRIGQTRFSEEVKNNYNHTCCFPGCLVNDPRFLIGSHIARWVDNPEKRGNLSNGLCFCVFHDKAFENGYFSITNDYQIILNKTRGVQSSSVFQREILPFENQRIKDARIPPDIESLAEHRFRCKIE